VVDIVDVAGFGIDPAVGLADLVMDNVLDVVVDLTNVVAFVDVNIRNLEGFSVVSAASAVYMQERQDYSEAVGLRS
jgi:L-serine deaminase